MATASISSALQGGIGNQGGDDDAKKKALIEEIDAKKKLIASLPNWDDIDTKAGHYERADHIKQLAEMEYKYELQLESERIDSVVREHEELYPPYTEGCPICLEDIPYRSSQSMAKYYCCGNGVCSNCHKAGGMLNNKCPLCRARPKSAEESTKLLKRCAENGRTWAQTDAGTNYVYGINGFPFNLEKGLRWLMLAANQNDPAGLHHLALVYKDGNGVERIRNGVEQSNSKAQEMMTKAASLGYAPAQFALMVWYYFGEAGFAVDKSKSLYYATLCCNHEQNADAENFLASFHYDGEGGLRKSLHIASHYFERSAEGGNEDAYYIYGSVLLELWQNQYNSTTLPGHCALPQILYWLRKAAANGDSEAAHKVDEIEKSGTQYCHYCNKEAISTNETMKCCAKCKAAWYCGRECQVKAWKEGHKTDCVKHV